MLGMVKQYIVVFIISMKSYSSGPKLKKKKKRQKMERDREKHKIILQVEPNNMTSKNTQISKTLNFH